MKVICLGGTGGMGRYAVRTAAAFDFVDEVIIADLNIKAAEELAKLSVRQETVKMYFPEKKGGGLVLEGDAADLADQLITIIKDKTSVLA